MGWKIGTLNWRSDRENLPLAIMDLFPNGYWKLDEAGGTTAYDSSGYDRHGTYHGDVVLADQRGPYGRYPNFRQIGVGVTVPDSDDFSLGLGGVTICAVVKFGRALLADTGPVTIVGKSSEWLLGKENIGHPLTATLGSAGIFRGAEGLAIDMGTNTDPEWTDTWHLFTASFTAAGVCNFYTDTLQTGTPFGPSGTLNGNQATSLNIGGTSDDTLGDQRCIAHVAVWNRLLDGTELTSLIDAANADHWHPA